jgi:hypothetical protein
MPPACKNCHKWKETRKHYELYFAPLEKLEKLFKAKKYNEVVSVFQRFQGPELTKFKQVIQLYGRKDLETIFGSLKPPLQNRLIAYFRTQAHQKVVHVITDVDDTLFPSSVGGSDISWEDHKFYPGVLQLMYELSGSYVTFLSSRPSLLKNGTHQKFANMCIPNDVLGGTVGHILSEGVLNWFKVKRKKYDHLSGYTKFATKKISNFKRYKLFFPEYSFIFFGDIGQGDVVAARSLIEDPSVATAVIHDISRHPDQESLSEERKKQENLSKYLHKGIIVGKNYVEIAWYLYHHSFLLSREAMMRIVDSAIDDIQKTKTTSKFVTDTAQEHLRRNLTIKHML